MLQHQTAEQNSTKVAKKSLKNMTNLKYFEQ
jgi:hypothetical protein